MRCRKGIGKALFICGGNLHGVERHVHVVLCDEYDAALRSEMGLEPVAVVEIAVVRNRIFKTVKDGNAFIRLCLCFLGHAKLVHEVPAVCPEFAAQNIFVEKICGLRALDCHIDMIKRRCLRFLFTGFQCTQSLESVDFFLYILRQLLVRLGVYDALKEFHRLCPMLRHLCEEMCEPCAGMPVLCTARKKLMGRCC